MRLAIQAWRKGHLKVVGSVIDEALRRGHQVTLLYAKDSKLGEGIAFDELAARWPAVDIASDHSRIHADAILGDPSIGDDMVLGTKPHGPVLALDFVWEQRMRPRKEGVTRCWATEFHRAYFGEQDEPVTGMTALDALPLVDPAEVRARYGFGDRPIVLLFSLKLGVPHLWRKTVFRYWHYVTILHAIKDMCRREGALLVVKTREKHGDPRLVHQLADRVITDERLWPYTSAELVRVADYVIHFQSGAVFEAAAADVPQLSIRVPQPHLAHFPGHTTFFSRAQHTLQHWPGVVESADYTEAWDRLRQPWPKLDASARARYAEQYIGPLDGKSASRVLDMVESRCRA